MEERIIDILNGINNNLERIGDQLVKINDRAEYKFRTEAK